MKAIDLDRFQTGEERSGRGYIRSFARSPLVGAACGVASLAIGPIDAIAQQAPAALPAVTVDAPKETTRPRARPTPVRAPVAAPARPRPVRQVVHTPQPAAPAGAPAPSANAGVARVQGEGGGGGSAYNPRRSEIDRLPTPILDTPQSITIVPQQVIQDQHTSTLVEALHDVPGISFLGGEGGQQGDNLNIHGYSARNDIYRDGIRDPGWYTRDTFSVENVEVLKGPSSFAFGRGSTGGVVNETSKLPKFADFTEIEAAGYTSPGARTTLDVNRAFGDVAARVVVLGNDTDVADRPYVQTKRVGVAPSIRWNIAPDTRATLSYVYQHDDNVPDYGIPLLPGSYFGTKYAQPAPVGKDRFYGTAYDRERVDAHAVTLKLEHDLTKDWRVTNSTRYSSVDRFVSVRGTQVSATNLYASPTGGAPLAVLPPGFDLDDLYVANKNYFQNHTRNTLATNLSDITGRFRTGPLEHTFDAGVELSRETRDQFRSTYTGAFDRVNIGNPDATPAVLGTLPAISTDQVDVGRGVGLYASDQVKIGKYFELMGGVRFDHLSVSQFSASEDTYTHVVTGPYSATVPYNLVNKVDFTSWRTGAVFHPVENASLYYVVGNSFDPTSEYLTIAGGTQHLPPTTNRTQELGAKVDLLDHRLSVTSALFRTVQENAVEAVNSTLGIYEQVGKTRVQGFEVGIAGKITDRWSLFGGYTYMDGRVLASAISQTTGTYVSAPGNYLQNVPRDTFTMTSTYAVTPKMTFGGSAYYTSARYTNSANTGLVPGYWRFDAMASYKIDRNWSVQANLQNILDTKNFESLSGFGAAQPGPGRTGIVTVRYRF